MPQNWCYCHLTFDPCLPVQILPRILRADGLIWKLIFVETVFGFVNYLLVQILPIELEGKTKDMPLPIRIQVGVTVRQNTALCAALRGTGSGRMNLLMPPIYELIQFALQIHQACGRAVRDICKDAELVRRQGRAYLPTYICMCVCM